MFHEGGLLHGDIKPSNVILRHVNPAVKNLTFATALELMLIDFSAFKGVLSTTWLYTSSAVLRGGDYGACDEMESLFWTLVDVCSKGAFQHFVRRTLRERRRRASVDDPTVKIVPMLLELRANFMATLDHSTIFEDRVDSH